MEIYFPLEINDLTIFEKYYRIKLFWQIEFFLNLIKITLRIM